MRNEDIQCIPLVEYARKSSEPEDRQMTSIPDQLQEMGFVKVTEKLNVLETLTEAKSAKEPGRPVFDSMIKMAEAGIIKGIFCWKLNRLARNPVDGGKIIWLLQTGKIKCVKTINAEFRPEDNLLPMYIEFGMASQYSSDLSVDIRRGIRSKADRGWYPAANLPIGYKHNKIGVRTRGLRSIKNRFHDKEIVPDDNFPIVKSLWKLALSGKYTTADICRIAKQRGLRNRNGNPYSLNTFCNLFRNPFYYGDFYSKNQSGISVLYHGKHKPMVTRLEFDKVQKILGYTNNPKRDSTFSFRYRGLVKCGECLGNITAERKNRVICTRCRTKSSILHRDNCKRCGLHVINMPNPSKLNCVYHHCSRKTTPSCKQRSTTQSNMDADILQELNKVSIHRDFALWIKDALQSKGANTSSDTEIIKQWKKKIADFDNKLKGLILMKSSEQISDKEFECIRRDILHSKNELEKNILNLEESKKQWKPLTMHYIDFMTDVVKGLK